MMIKEHHFLLHWAHRRRPSGVHLRHLWHLERNDTRFWWSGFDHVYDVCSVGVLSKLQQSSFCWPPLDLNCIVMARNRWLHIRSSMASSPERVGVFSYTSLLPILKHIDSGLSLMITALSSLATKVEEMGWVSFHLFFLSFFNLVLITCFCLCQHSSRSGLDWNQLFCPFFVRTTRCSAWNNI